MNKYKDYEADYALTHPRPEYPQDKDYTTFYAYKAGKVIDKFETMAAAKAASDIVEKVTDRAGREKALRKYNSWDTAVREWWYNDLRAEYHRFNDDIFNTIYSMAYDNGHSSGYDEVALYVDNYADFADKIISYNMYDSIKKAFEETNPAPSFPVETDYNMYYVYRNLLP